MDRLAQEFYTLTGKQLNPRQMAALRLYAQELAHWNATHNLTAIREPEQVRVKHFLDSLSACLVMRG
jgi:16S rRNA (guanine527-N7)-methyltransferase